MKITIQIRVESDEGQLEVVQQLAHLDRGIRFCRNKPVSR